MEGFNIPILHNCSSTVNIVFTIFLIFKFCTNLLVCITNNFKFKKLTKFENQSAVLTDMTFLILSLNTFLLFTKQEITFAVMIIENIIIGLLFFTIVDCVFAFKAKYNFKDLFNLSGAEYKRFMSQLKIDRSKGFVFLLIATVFFRVQAWIPSVSVKLVCYLITLGLLLMCKHYLSNFINSIKDALRKLQNDKENLDLEHHS